uniref:Uncharacterized protein n=1 Tax=Arundo donax TaxID=35708 RepID=A0A0A9H5Y4_ARUDO
MRSFSGWQVLVAVLGLMTLLCCFSQ